MPKKNEGGTGRGKHPNSRANLRDPWPAGQSANPAGRAKSPYADAHRLVADALVKDLGISPKDTVAIGIAKVVAQKALKGHIDAAKESANRTEGPPTQRHEIAGTESNAIQVEAKLSTGDLLGAISQIYGLGHRESAEGPAPVLPVPGEVGEGPVAKKDSRKK